ncbi:Serine/threonine-protein phosphatase 2A regulatory subunit B'' subunit gamma [Chytriomyces hyalinus]|nr:Serine/threonine-protein phosphatase 2A regulatory subunit B'' subunit gamma [Chytriomyces hyalinus]
MLQLPKLTSRIRAAGTRARAPADPASKAVQAAFDAAVQKCYIERHRSQLLTSEDLDMLWDLLWEHASGGTPDERRLSYDDFVAVRELLPPKFDAYMKSSIFMQFLPDEWGHVSVLFFFNFVLRKVGLMQARLDMSSYDADKDGYLTEPEFEAFLLDLLPTLNLDNLSPDVEHFYVCSTSRKFFYCLDTKRRGKLSIQQILLSNTLIELFELREAGRREEIEQNNWFSCTNSMRLYERYSRLDTNNDGLLSRSEMTGFQSATYSSAYLDRLFHERSSGGQIDYRTFVDLVLAVDNPMEPESIAFQFRLLDMKNQGFLDEATVTFMFRSVLERMVEFGHEPVNLSDVVNEIFDMASPKCGSYITLNDLLASGIGGTITTILSDCRGFWAYDNRESEGK